MMKSTPPSSDQTPVDMNSPTPCEGTTNTSTTMSSAANRMACTISVISEPRMPERQQYAKVSSVNKMAAMMNGAEPDVP